MQDENYGDLSENMIISIIKKAKNLSQPDSTAEEVIFLTRRIVEHNADITANVNYVMNGLIKRSIFEYTKKKVAGN